MEKQVLSVDEMGKACQVAKAEVMKRMEQFKPANNVIKEKEGSVQEQVFRGRHGNELLCAMKIVWFYTSSGCVGRISEYVHVRLRILQKPEGRFLRLVDMHKPIWVENTCTTCGDVFSERHVIESDTSYQEE